MEIRLRPILLILLLATVTTAAAVIGLPRLQIGPLAFRARATPTAPAVMTQTLASQLITFADESTAWDWQATCQDDLATWVQQSSNPVRTIRVTLTDEQNLGPATVGAGYPTGSDQAAIAYAACDGQPDLACQVAIKQGAAGDDLNVAVTAAIPHAIRNAWLIHAPGGAEQIDAIRKNWSWEQFQPLLQKEGTVWRSSCLTVTHGVVSRSKP